MDGGYLCSHCHRKFPFVNGIADLMPCELLDERSLEYRQHSAYRASFSGWPDRAWKQPLRSILHRFGNGYLFSWAARAMEEFAQGRALTILDAGCGDGNLKSHISRRHIYLGVDFSARPLLRASRYRPGTYFRADLNHLPFPDNSFDVVVSLQVLQYLADPRKALAHMARILRPQGKLLLTVPNAQSIKYRIEGIPEIQLQRFDRSRVLALLAENFEDSQIQAQGMWIPFPISLHAPGCYPASWGLSWTVIAAPRK